MLGRRASIFGSMRGCRDSAPTVGRLMETWGVLVTRASFWANAADSSPRGAVCGAQGRGRRLRVAGSAPSSPTGSSFDTARSPHRERDPSGQRERRVEDDEAQREPTRRGLAFGRGRGEHSLGRFAPNATAHLPRRTHGDVGASDRRDPSGRRRGRLDLLEVYAGNLGESLHPRVKRAHHGEIHAGHSAGSRRHRRQDRPSGGLTTTRHDEVQGSA